MQIGETYSGFKLQEQKKLEEINSEGMLFYHEKSGARLFFLKNEDDNKVFSISFRTPPDDSRGVPHILEHSVLCGSKKFPVKEPFVELVKGSLNTFLNAMTFPDKTMYPVASVNDKDFANLMDVYLDAVFQPNIYRYPEIMMQEGWHYELNSREEDMTYKGVVYNEMKGAFSSPESILFRKMLESLYPDTQYGVESGGDPDVIPQLTQQQFLDFHSRYYHPSNSYIYLYGNMDIIEKLEFLDREYLSHFEKKKVDSALITQKPFQSCREMTVEYPISSAEKEKDKTFLSINYSVGKAVDNELYLAFDILEHMLLETPSSPLKKALIDAGIGKDVFGVFESGMLQPMFGIVAKGSNENEKRRFQDTVEKTLNDIVDKGIDKKLVEASVNIKEFQLREADYKGYPKGLIYGMKCMDGWLYDEAPWTHLTYESVLNKIKSQLDNNYFENLINRYILKNNHSSMLIIRPERGLEEKKDALLKEKLKTLKDSLSEDEIQKIIQDTLRLKKRQMTRDSKEDLMKIPLLSIEDIDPNPKDLKLVKNKIQDVEVLFYPVFTNGIYYVNLYFNTEGVKEELIPYVSLLSAVLGKVSTENYYYEDLAKEINIYTGGINYSSQAFSENGNSREFYPKFIVKSKVLVNNMEKLISILKEIINYTKFDEKKRLKEIIQETKSRIEMTIFERGHVVVANHVSSYFSPASKYEDMIGGLEFYKFISNLENNFDSKVEEIRESLKEVSNEIFNKNNLILNITCDEADYDNLQDRVKELISGLKDDKVGKISYKFDLKAKNEGLMTSSKIQYVAKAYNYIDLGYSYSGSLQVLKSIANYEYLWNQVRVQGGAYGSFASFQRNGNMFFTSYRDPNLKHTLEVYDKAGEFFNNFNADDRQMVKYIIGTISDLDFPLSPSMKGERAVENYIRHVSYEDLQKERQEILNTGVEDIKGFSKLISSSMNKDNICVLGNEQKIKKNKDLFKNLVNLFE
ncbi:MAG: insulinase family protein [Clostridium luticellarii]|jgi:Zn-dependent M16 (insulinase) family peptidase|uniref:insulinase family protein n=1 Tax=Clostridium luticellarii TaxID=1691940 RepID=UPI002353A567|nr:insulinase family protein [Clostridium luticellarii]MCI1995471.1 insulinase family protein [Clostridium luticellarii]MCI2040386.1 insulinase family protein [Clostridium luticellarii]